MRVSTTHIDAGSFRPDNVTAGMFTILAPSNIPTKLEIKAATPHSDFVGKYVLDPGRTLSAYEQSLVPVLEPWYVLPEEVITICQHAKQSTGKSMPMRNFLLRGPAGTGKTEGARAIAAGLNLPYMKYTCSANTEVFDFIGQVFPDTEGPSTGAPELDRQRQQLKEMGGITYENIIMSNDAFRLRDNYYEEATQFLIDVFVELRKRGIYEDRIMRKLKSFSKAQVYFSDCAATSGSQIVVAPNGQVGICHGCLYDKNYFVSDIYDDDFLASKNSTFIEWSQLTPINRDECMDCPVLGICGGGCPVNAMNSKPSNTIHSVDDHFCVHAKKTLDFLIHDLFRIILKNQTTDI